MKAILMARVSSKGQGFNQNENLSIEAQVQRLQNYAAYKELEVISTVTIIEQSSKGGVRKQFNSILKTIKGSPSTIALVVETVDRLLRNFKDSTGDNGYLSQYHFMYEVSIQRVM